MWVSALNASSLIQAVLVLIQQLENLSSLVQRLTRDMRSAIKEGRYPEYVRTFVYQHYPRVRVLYYRIELAVSSFDQAYSSLLKIAPFKKARNPDVSPKFAVYHTFRDTDSKAI